MAVDGVYIIVYTVIGRTVINMTVAKVFKNGRSQAVRLPKEYRFSSDEVVINRIGDIVLLMPKTSQWESFMKAIDMFSDDFMKDGRDNQGVQEREAL
jgi:antitoxin VapB